MISVAVFTLTISCAVTFWYATGAAAQAFRSHVDPGEPIPEPVILTGADIGFRLNAVQTSFVPTGDLVIRRNGRWVAVKLNEYETVPGIRPLTH